MVGFRNVHIYFWNNHSLSLVFVDGWSSFSTHTGDEIRIQTSETDLNILSLFVFASVWSDQVHEEHHEGPGSLRCRFPVVPKSSAQKYRAGGSAPEPDRGDNPEPEEGACLDVCMRESQREGVMTQDRKWENILGNNILVSPDQSFLGFYRAAPCRRKRRTPQRYCLLGFSLFWEEGAVYSLKEVL